MADRSTFEIEKLCTRIYAECSSLVTWKWDERFQTLLTEFHVESMNEVISAMKKHFDNCWDKESIGQAPGKVKSVAGGLGEVREGQLLFASDPDKHSILLGALWPWQNGKKISLRFRVDVPDIDLGLGTPSYKGIQSPLYT